MNELWIFLLYALLFQTPPPTESTPFLYNPSVITTFLSSASSAASSPDTNGNIQDFTKQAHEPKKLQADQDLDHSPGPDDQNEVVPSIIQKKISKILRKIQFFTQLSGGGGGGGSGSGTVMDDLDDFFKDEEDDMGNKETPPTTEANDKKGEVEEITESASSETTSVEKPSKYAVSPSSIAVFFMELVGTVMGLFYGATAQLGQGQNVKTN